MQGLDSQVGSCSQVTIEFLPEGADTMPTLGELVDQVVATLAGHSSDMPAMGSLIGSITPTSTEIAIDFGDTPGASRPNGYIEIGDEIIAISSFNPSTGVAQLGSWGRGQRGTVASSHDAGDMVTVRPRYPRKHVANTINQVVASSCPPLYAPRDLDPIETGAFVDVGYPLPADTMRVLRVDSTEDAPELVAERRLVRDWTVRSVGGQKLLQLNRCDTFASVLVTIAATPGRMTSESDDFVATTGLSESVADLVVFGAIARLILGIDLARQQITSVEAANRSDRIGVSSGSTVSRYYQALYTQRLEAEQTRLMQSYPITLLRRG